MLELSRSEKTKELNNQNSKKAQKTLTVSIAGGLDKNTDTAPVGVTRPTGTTGGRGRATGGRGGNTGGGNTGGGQQPISIQPNVGNTGGGNTGRGRATGGGPTGGGPMPPNPGRGGGPPPPSNQPKAKAMYPYQGQTQDELSFGQNDILIIHKKDPGGWWEGELNGKRGWIPANYVQEI